MDFSPFLLILFSSKLQSIHEIQNIIFPMGFNKYLNLVILKNAAEIHCSIIYYEQTCKSLLFYLSIPRSLYKIYSQFLKGQTVSIIILLSLIEIYLCRLIHLYTLSYMSQKLYPLM